MRRKTLLLLGGAALVGLLLLASCQYHPAELTVSVDAPDEVAEDSDFVARVMVTQIKDFDACDYEVLFDPAVLQLTEVTDGEIDGTAIPVVGTNEIEAGRVKVVENVPGFPGVTGSGYLAELHFHATGSDGQSSTIELKEGCLSDKEANKIPASWAGHSVSITSHPGEESKIGGGGWAPLTYLGTKTIYAGNKVLACPCEERERRSNLRE